MSLEDGAAATRSNQPTRQPSSWSCSSRPIHVESHAPGARYRHDWLLALASRRMGVRFSRREPAVTNPRRPCRRRSRRPPEPTQEDEMSTASPMPITQQELEQAERANATPASISERENLELEAANASGSTPVVFIHGL